LIQPLSGKQTPPGTWSLLPKRNITQAGVADLHVIALTDDKGR